MKFIRPKKLMFTNNKGGVGKTTLSYNIACKFANKGYKVAIIDLDPQCNISLQVLQDKFKGYIDKNNIYNVLKGLIEGGSDINLDVKPVKTEIDNLFILPGSINLNLYEDLLINAYNSATAGQQLGYFQTSAIDRYLRELGLNENIDLFIIDTSPNLGLLNRIVFLGTDFFIVPLNPDAFSLQGIQNLGIVFDKWIKQWNITAKAVSGDIESKKVLKAEALFLGYIINSYNTYSKKPIKAHNKFINEIPKHIQKFLSNKFSKNGLVNESYKNPLEIIQDYGMLGSYCQKNGKAFFNLENSEIKKLRYGTIENIEKAKTEFETLYIKIENLLKKY